VRNRREIPPLRRPTRSQEANAEEKVGLRRRCPAAIGGGHRCSLVGAQAGMPVPLGGSGSSGWGSGDGLVLAGGGSGYGVLGCGGGVVTVG